MKLYLYQNISDEKKVGKSLSLVETITAVKWKEDTDILHPVFTFCDADQWFSKKLETMNSFVAFFRQDLRPRQL